MSPSSVGRWSLAADAAPAWRRWGDEVVVHHALSNDTHRIAGTAGRMLEWLGSADGVDAETLAHEMALEPDHVRALLAALEELGLVAQC